MWQLIYYGERRKNEETVSSGGNEVVPHADA
jgi:hypothetical protein